MLEKLTLDGKVAVVTGGGGGLGIYYEVDTASRAHICGSIHSPHREGMAAIF